MEVDLDNFDDDIFAGVAAKNNNARAGGRFQPRAKRGPVKKQPAAASLRRSLAWIMHPTLLPRVKSLLNLIFIHVSTNEVLNCWDVTTQEKVDHTAESLAETGQHSGLENSFGENDIACPHSTTEAPAIPVFQSPEDGFAPAVISCPLVLDSSSSGSTFILSKGHDIVCPESSPIEDPLASCPESPLNEDPLTGGHPIVSVSEGSSLMHDGRSVIKQVESYPCLESLDTPDITSYGPRIGKFQPKPKIHEARSKVCTPNPEVGKSGVCENQHLDPSEFQNTISECHEDDVLDLSSLGFDNSLPLEPAFQQPAQDMSLEQPAQDEGNAEAVCDMHESMGTREAKGDQPSTSTSSQLSRPHRKCNNGRKLVDESEDEEPNEISVDTGELVVHHGDDKELQVNNKSQEKKKPRKRSNKPVVDKEKPVRKPKKFGEATNQDTTNKKAGEATNQDTGTKSKKFPHSTRQRKRRVDQTLLETPEDLIEYQKVPMRDLIILADYKERMTKKTATTSQVPSTGQIWVLLQHRTMTMREFLRRV
ncbi:hypothetical protein Leryth_017864 [Lithospermum erythrorhizon]|nr:hypothetical protein Leryth_017864 [Lithospermum erythrorhizon]